MDNDSVANANVYGVLYNWSAITDNRKICPLGYHVPGNSEWNAMEKYLDASVDTLTGIWTGTYIGGILKEAGTSHWLTPNTGATDSVGFTALPGGYRDEMGNYQVFYSAGDWWTNTLTTDTNFAFGRGLDFSSAQILRNPGLSLSGGFSVRCICDSLALTINENSKDNQMNIFPNPALDKITIQIADKQNLNLFIYNVTGQLVMQKELKNNKNEFDISIIRERNLYS